VRDAATAPAHLLSGQDRFHDALSHLSSERNAWPVADGQRLLGMISLSQVQDTVSGGGSERRLDELPVAALPTDELTSENFPHVHLDHTLDNALKRMADSHSNVLPVVSRSDLRGLQGIVTLNGILQAYGIGERVESAVSAREEPRPPRRLVPAVALAAVASLILIALVNYYYRSQRVARAEDSYKAGRSLAQQGRDDEAVQQFRNALSISPGNARYQLALGLELVKMKSLDEGAVYLRELLRNDAANAPANLGLARIAAARDATSEAVTYYQRAIDGTWSSAAQVNRRQVRLELADYLAKHGLKTQAVAALLAALADAHEPEAKERIGSLLLEYGSPRQAAEVFRDISRSNSQDQAAWAGLGAAELALENYPESASAFRNAVRLNPADKVASGQLEISEKVLALDPDARGIRAAERHRRAAAILQGVLDSLERCASGPANQQLRDQARKALAFHPKPGSLGDATEEDLTLATELWQPRRQTCPANNSSDDALERVLARLSRN